MIDFRLEVKDSEPLILESVERGTIIIGKAEYQRTIGLSLLEAALKKNLPMVYLDGGSDKLSLPSWLGL